MKEYYGTTKGGVEISKYTLTNSKGSKAVVLDYGAILDQLWIADSKGNLDDVVLSCPDADSYVENPCSFGSTIGPSANRIADAKFTIDGVEYKLDKNDGENNLHSSFPKGLNKRIWKAVEKDNSVEFSIEMEDGDLGFPGNKKFTVTYTLTDDNELRIDYFGKSDKNTIINLTNHSYFNLGGHKSGDICKHVVKLESTEFTKIRAGAIPTGEIVSVLGTELDFSEGKEVGKDIEKDNDQMKLVNGYDFNYVISGYDGSLRLCSTATDPVSGRKMEVYTDLPGFHFYTGNWINNAPGKEGMTYGLRAGMCFETQYYPDTIHHDNFPSAVFGPDRDYKSTTVFKFL